MEHVNTVEDVSVPLTVECLLYWADYVFECLICRAFHVFDVLCIVRVVLIKALLIRSGSSAATFTQAAPLN